MGLFVLILVGGGVVGGLYLSGRNKLKTEVLAGEDIGAIGGFEDPVPTTDLPVMEMDENGNVTMIDQNGEVVKQQEPDAPETPEVIAEKDPIETPENAVQDSAQNQVQSTSQNPAQNTSQNASQEKTSAPETFNTAPANTVEMKSDEAGVVTYKGQRYRYNEDLITILVMGIDKNSTVTAASHGSDGGQADAIFLLLLDGSSGQINIVTINRNSMAKVDVYNRNGSYFGQGMMQLTLQHAYGDGMGVSNARMAEAVSRMFHNIPIHAYASLNMAGIATLNDTVGGVTVTPIMDIPGSSIRKGEPITLMGKQAYDYVHWRDINEFASADLRLEREKQYLAAYGKKVLAQIKTDPSVVTGLYNAVQKYLVTDLSLDRITYLAAEAGGYHFDAANIYSVPGTTKMGRRYEEYYVDEEALRDLIIRLFFKQI